MDVVKTGLFISTLHEITSGVTRKYVYNYILILHDMRERFR